MRDFGKASIHGDLPYFVVMRTRILTADDDQRSDRGVTQRSRRNAEIAEIAEFRRDADQARRGVAKRCYRRMNPPSNDSQSWKLVVRLRVHSSDRDPRTAARFHCGQ